MQEALGVQDHVVAVVAEVGLVPEDPREEELHVQWTLKCSTKIQEAEEMKLSLLVAHGMIL